MRKLTHKEFKQKVIRIHGNIYKFLTIYVTGRDRIKVKCTKCTTVWNPIASTLTKSKGCGCPACGLKKAKDTVKWNLDTEKYMDRLGDNIKSKIEFIDDYTGCNEYIKIKCKICRHTWRAKPTYLKQGFGCSKCGREAQTKKVRKKHPQFLEEINIEHNNTIELTSEYISGNMPIAYKCVICGNCGEKKEARSLRSRGCIYCNFSKGEKKIKKLLDENKIRYETQYSFGDLKNKKKLMFDFAIFGSNTISHMIEYDGQQHYKPIKYFGGQKRFLKQLENDKLKDEYCKNNNIRLIRIPYYEYRKLTIEKLL
jgi:hypothetical protein